VNARGLVLAGFMTICALVAMCAPDGAYCEKWIEFHAEKWDFNSDKINKKLKFRNVYFYDADKLARGKNGYIAVWVKELANIDRYYVGKGVPEQETIYNQIRINCISKKYDILIDDGSESEYSDSMSEVIAPGSYYDKLFSIVCKPQK
jgi:hypothetical protein